MPIAVPMMPRLGERRVDHAVGAELVEQAAGGAEHAAELADVLAEHDDARVAPHLDAQRVVDRLDDVHDGHRLSCPPWLRVLGARLRHAARALLLAQVPAAARA